MREIINVTYQAEDGVVFDNSLSCEAYERFEEMLRIYTRRKAGILFSDYNDCAEYITWLVNYKTTYTIECFNPHEYIRRYPDILHRKCIIDVNRKGEIIHRFK